jgi:glycosyltransferase involved in cell wall biosynthesis
MKVCIISSGSFVSNPRIVKEAIALRNVGWRVTAIACSPLPEQEEADAEVRKALGVETKVISFGKSLTWWAQRLRQESAKGLFSLGFDRCLGGHSARTKTLCRTVKSVAADLYIAHYVAALPAAAEAARVHQAPYAFDAEDFHSGELPDLPQNRTARKLIRMIEARYLPKAAYVTAASPMIADAYAETYGIPRPIVVLNVFPRSSAPPTPTPRGVIEPGPTLYWFSQTIGAGRGLETAVEAIARAATKPHLHLRGIPASGFQAKLLDIAHKRGVANRVHFLASARPHDLERLGAQYDLGYSGETGFCQNRELALPNKLFSYLLSGIPIIASDVPAHRALGQDVGAAMTIFAAGDATGLAESIDCLLSDPDRLSAARTQAWRLGQSRYCWEVETASFLAAVERAVQHAATAELF